ncbi:hypothetical protein H8356DRAFT_1326499 [Neocallimastix lanati (nom. inval.)]|nr:hypothetical protein H8356DRAFT_1326499 [Neocallimastix sp. JGI-2020a]
MKLLSLVLITLASTTSIFANPYMKRNDMDGYEVCSTDILDNLNCYTPEIGSNQDEICKTFKTEKCTNWLKNPLSAKGCNVAGDYKNILELPVKLGSTYMELYCTKNEGSETGLCPVFDSELDLISFTKSPKEDDLKKVVEDSCKSEPCAKSLYNYYKMIISYKTTKENLKDKTFSASLISISNEDEQLYSKYMNELKECAKIEDEASEKEKSDAFITKMNTTLLIISSLLVSFILF